MWQSICFIRWDLPLAGLLYMLMMNGGRRFSIVGIVYICTTSKKEAMNEQLMAQLEAEHPI